MKKETSLYDKNMAEWPKRKQAEFTLRFIWYFFPQLFSAFSSEAQKKAFFDLEFFDRAMWETLSASDRVKYEQEMGLRR